MLQADVIAVKFSYDKDEFLVNRRDFYLRYYFTRHVPIFVGSSLAFAEIFLSPKIGLSALSFWLYVILMIGGLVITVVAISFIKSYRNWRKIEQYGNEYYLEFTEDGTYSKSYIGESRLKWVYFKKARESNTAYLLSYDNRGGLFIPKSAFSPQQDTSFRELLSRKLNFDAAIDG